MPRLTRLPLVGAGTVLLAEPTVVAQRLGQKKRAALRSIEMTGSLPLAQAPQGRP
jgi:hypothetical protein